MTATPSADLQTMWTSLQTSLHAHRPRDPDAAEEPAGAPDGGPTEAPDDEPVPVTLLTGFLGAGKSSLLAELLMAPPNGIIARAVVNDVGSLPFDPSFVIEDGLVDVELSNGCGCCVSTSDLAETLDRVAADGADLIVFETSGLADPLALAQIVEAGPRLRLDRLVAVVDGSAIERQLGDPTLGPCAKRQLDAAQVVVVSHLDVLSASEAERVLGRVAELAPGATVAPSRPEQPALASLVPTASGRGSETGTVAPGSFRGARLPITDDAPPHLLVTAGAEQHRALTSTELEAALAEAATLATRVKGWLRVDGATADERTVDVQVAGGSGTSDERPAVSTPAGVDGHRLTIVAADDATVHAIAGLLGCRVITES